MSESNQEALAAAWSGTVTPYSQIKDATGPTDAGQYDLVVGKLTPQIGEKNGLYCIEGEFPVTSPPGFTFPYRRTLWVGTHKDPLAKLPETRLNSPGLRFLKKIATANNLPTNDMSDAALCASLLGKAFGCRIEETSYKDAQGNEKKGTDFGRNVTPVGVVPARLDKVAATVNAANGHDATAMAGATFTE